MRQPHQLTVGCSTDEVKEAILKGIARGDIWLAKIRSDQHGRRIYANVCLEVFLRSRGTCLLEHINLGACTPEDIPAAFVAGMEELVELHRKLVLKYWRISHSRRRSSSWSWNAWVLPISLRWKELRTLNLLKH